VAPIIESRDGPGQVHARCCILSKLRVPLITVFVSIGLPWFKP